MFINILPILLHIFLLPLKPSPCLVCSQNICTVIYIQHATLTYKHPALYYVLLTSSLKCVYLLNTAKFLFKIYILSSFEQNLSVSEFICYFFLWILTSIEDNSLLCYHSDVDSYGSDINLT